MSIPETGKEVAVTLNRSLRGLIIATIVLYLVLAVGGILVYSQGRTTTQALCTFRDDLTLRVVNSIKFLKEHPNGIPGIPPRTILEGIQNQQRTILALKELSCDTDIPELNLGPTPTTTPTPSTRRNP